MSEVMIKLAAIVFGDGYVTKKGNVSFHHSIIQKSWVDYKCSLLSDLGFKMKTSTNNTLSGFSTQKGYTGYSTSTAEGKKLREIFYPDNKKKIPVELIREFGWFEWSIIFQDDGRTNKCSHINIYKDGKKERRETPPFVNRYEICFGYLDIDSLTALQFSLKNLGVDSYILTRRDGQKNIAISRKDSKIKFFENIKSYIHPSMSYKIDIIPSLTLLR